MAQPRKGLHSQGAPTVFQFQPPSPCTSTEQKAASTGPVNAPAERSASRLDPYVKM